MADHLRVDAGEFKVGGGIFAAAGNNDFSGAGLAQERLHNRFDGEKLEVNGGVEFIENNRFVKTRGNGSSSNFPAAFGFNVVNFLLLTAPNNGIPTTAVVID